MTRLSHGCYCVDSGFSIQQHSYAGANFGYIEAIEVLDSPPGKHGILMVYCSAVEELYCFVEFETIDDAIREVDRLRWGGSIDTGNPNPFQRYQQATPAEFYASRPGFKRFVELEPGQQPWFYARLPDLVRENLDYTIGNTAAA